MNNYSIPTGNKLKDSLEFPMPGTPEQNFKYLYKELSRLINEVFNELLVFDDEKTRLSNTRNKSSKIELNKRLAKIKNHDLLKIERIIEELAKPKYKDFLDSLKFPDVPLKSPDDDEDEYNTAFTRVRKEIEIQTYIKELLKSYSIYDNHDCRDYYSALCSHLASAYADRFGETVKIVFRYKSPKELMLKLAKNIFIYSNLLIDPSNTKKPSFRYDSLHDAFGIKIISTDNSDKQADTDSDITSLIEEKNRLFSQLKDFDLFQSKLQKGETISNREYLTYCSMLLEFTKDKTVNELHTEKVDYISNKINEIQEKYNDLELESSLESPVSNEIKQAFNYNHWLHECRNLINKPLTFAILRKNVLKILKPTKKSLSPASRNDPDTVQDSITKLFKISAGAPDDKNYPSGHDTCHIDIKTSPFPNDKHTIIIMECQISTKAQYEADKHSPTQAHSLMDNKQLEKQPIPKELTPEEIANTSDALIMAQDSKGVIHSYLHYKVDEFKKLVELITPKMGEITYNPHIRLAKVTFYSSLENYLESSSEYPGFTNDATINKAIEDCRHFFLLLSRKSGAIQKLLFHNPGETTEYWDQDTIVEFIEDFDKNAEAELIH